MSAAEIALRDFGGSILRLPLAVRLAIEDIHGKYRRTVLGPLWIMFGQAATIAGFTLVFSGLLRTSPFEYSLFLAAGLPIWVLISSFAVDMPSAFLQNKGAIESFETPWITHIWRKSFGYLFVFAHQIVSYFLLSLYLHKPVTSDVVFVLPGIAIVLLAGTGLGLLVAVIGARYRDLQHALGLLVSFAFFVTPVIWHPASLPTNGWIYQYNPLYYLITIVREPLLGQVPDGAIWLGAFVGAIVSMFVGLGAFMLNRGKLYIWL